MTRFARLAVAASLATYLLIVVGGLVRATDSGLACPDWPLCSPGSGWLAPPELHAWIEHSHRLIAEILVGPLVAAVAFITLFSTRRHDRPMLIAAVTAGVLVVLQALLGGQVVIQQLRAELVTAHLAMALTVLALTILIADRAAAGPLPASAAGGPTGLITLTAGAVFVQMLLGSWVSGSGAGLAFTDFPLMDGGLLPAITVANQAIQLLHRLLAIGVLALVVWVAMSVRARVSSGLARRLATAAGLLVLLQLALGAANIWSRLSALFVVPHLAVGAALWAVTVWLWLAFRRTTPQTPAQGAA